MPTFNVAQSCYHDIPARNLIENYHALLESHDSLSCMVDWPRDNTRWIFARRFVEAGDTRVPDYPSELYGGRLEERAWGQRGDDGVYRGSIATVTDLWSDVLPFNMPAINGRSTGEENVSRSDESAEMDEVQAEYFVSLADAVPALEATYSVAGKWQDTVDGSEDGALICKLCELRCVRGDDQTLSTVRGRDSLVM